jgi:predicted dehydrogenase
MKRVTMGVVGVGIAFRELHLPVLASRTDQVIIVAVTSQSLESMTAAQELVHRKTGTQPDQVADLDSFLARDFDAVFVNVPISHTAEVARKVLAAGHNLVCEKPLAETASEAATVVADAISGGRLLGYCENFRYREGFALARTLAAEGMIGKVKAYYLNDLHYMAPTGTYAVAGWRRRGEHRGGYLLDGGTHIVAAMRLMMGETPTSVYTVAASFHPDHLGRPFDTAFISLEFPSGATGHLALGYGSPDKEARHPKLLGTEGTIAVFRDRLEIWRHNSMCDDFVAIQNQTNGIPEEWDDFLPALRGERELRFSPWEAVMDLAVLDSVMNSVDARSIEQVERYGPFAEHYEP